MLKDAYEEAKQLLRNHRQALDKIATFLIEKETITGKEFMEIFHEVEGIDPDAPKKEEARIGMNPVEGEGFVMKPADDIDDAHNADVQEKSEKTEEKLSEQQLNLFMKNRIYKRTKDMKYGKSRLHIFFLFNYICLVYNRQDKIILEEI